MARAIAKTEAYMVSRRQRKKVEMLFAHLKRILSSTGCDYAVRMGHATNSSSPPPPRTCGSSRSWFRQRGQRQRGEATSLINRLAAPSLRRPDHLKIYFFNGIAPISLKKSGLK